MSWQSINWQAPWLSRYKAVGEPLTRRITLGTPVHAALNEALDSSAPLSCPVRFVPQTELQGASAYESFIWQTKTVPTRDNLHDFFNGLVWLHFPAIKTRLNQLQAAAIWADGVKATRGQLRDALTLFDENAALLIEQNVSTPLFQAIKDRAWQDAFVHRRGDWALAEMIIFGHALLEKLVSPRKAMTAHVFEPPIPLRLETYDHIEVDTHIAKLLREEDLVTKPFVPLPVLGVPGWCSENSSTGFYVDAEVFRVAKRRALTVN